MRTLLMLLVCILHSSCMGTARAEEVSGDRAAGLREVSFKPGPRYTVELDQLLCLDESGCDTVPVIGWLISWFYDPSDEPYILSRVTTAASGPEYAVSTVFEDARCERKRSTSSACACGHTVHLTGASCSWCQQPCYYRSCGALIFCMQAAQLLHISAVKEPCVPLGVVRQDLRH